MGYLEVAVVLFRQYVLGDIVYRSPHYLWMAPVGSLTVFVPAVVLLWLLAWPWRRTFSATAVTATLLFLATLTVLVLPGWLHEGAAVLLAAGATPHLTRLVLRHRRRVLRVVRYTLPAYAASVALLASVSFGGPALREAMARRGLASAPPGAPNVLLILLDTVRGGSASLLGYARATTPNLTWLATRGVTFERAVAPAPWTLPSHASLFTGHPPHELSAGFDAPLDDAQPTLAEILAHDGYLTAGFVANYFNADYEHGLGRGFHRWEDYRISGGQIIYNAVLTRRFLLDGPHGRQNSRLLQMLDLDMRIGEKTAEDVNARALEWLSRRDGRPAFVFLNYFDAHYPYDPPSPFADRFGAADTLTRPAFARIKRALSLTRWRGASPAAEREMRDLYEEEIAALDADIGDLLRALDARGLLDSTIVIVTSDHGEEFGEHGRYEHGNDLYMTQLHVPLVISWPGRIPSGVRVSTPVGLRHIGETILSMTGARGAGAMPGRSLETLWSVRTASAPPPAPVLSVLEKGGRLQASLVTSSLHYIYAEGEEHLYDHVADPAERDDLADEPWARDTLEALRLHLLERLADEAPEDLTATATP